MRALLAAALAWHGRGLSLHVQAPPARGQPCRDARPSERCRYAVAWARDVGARDHADWFPGDPAQYSPWDFQALLHHLGEAGCERPCPEGGDGEPGPPPLSLLGLHRAERSGALGDGGGEGTTARGLEELLRPWASGEAPLGAQEPCEDAVRGTKCHKAIAWLRRKGLQNHPEWFPGLSPRADAHDVQAALYNAGKSNCSRPCAPSGRTDVVALPPEAPDESNYTCQDARKGDWCYRTIWWLRSDGLRKHPDWYPLLQSDSPVRAFQQELHRQGKSGCRKPCPDLGEGPPREAPQDVLPPHTSAAAPPSAREVTCADDDARMVAVASGAGFTISGCANVQSYCEDQVYGGGVRQHCPVTCGVCTVPQQAPPEASKEVPREAQWDDDPDMMPREKGAEEGLARAGAPRARPAPPPPGVPHASGAGGGGAPEGQEQEAPREVPQEAPHGAPEQAPQEAPREAQKLQARPAVVEEDVENDGEHCHDALEGEECFVAVTRARAEDIFRHPMWFPILTPNSSFKKFQEFLWLRDKSGCGRPCPDEHHPGSAQKAITSMTHEEFQKYVNGEWDGYPDHWHGAPAPPERASPPPPLSTAAQGPMEQQRAGAAARRAEGVAREMAIGSGSRQLTESPPRPSEPAEAPGGGPPQPAERPATPLASAAGLPTEPPASGSPQPTEQVANASERPTTPLANAVGLPAGPSASGLPQPAQPLGSVSEQPATPTARPGNRTTAPVRVGLLEGHWVNGMGRKADVQRGQVIWETGEMWSVQAGKGDDDFSVSVDGHNYTARLVGSSRLEWSDGDVWNRSPDEVANETSETTAADGDEAEIYFSGRREDELESDMDREVPELRPPRPRRPEGDENLKQATEAMSLSPEARQRQKVVLGGHPHVSGCFMRLPSGCAKHPMKTRMWRHDVWAEENNLVESLCNARKPWWDYYCGTTDARVQYVGNTSVAGERQSENGSSDQQDMATINVTGEPGAFPPDVDAVDALEAVLAWAVNVTETPDATGESNTTATVAAAETPNATVWTATAETSSATMRVDATRSANAMEVTNNTAKVTSATRAVNTTAADSAAPDVAGPTAVTSEEPLPLVDQSAEDTVGEEPLPAMFDVEEAVAAAEGISARAEENATGSGPEVPQQSGNVANATDAEGASPASAEWANATDTEQDNAKSVGPAEVPQQSARMAEAGIVANAIDAEGASANSAGRANATDVEQDVANGVGLAEVPQQSAHMAEPENLANATDAQGASATSAERVNAPDTGEDNAKGVGPAEEQERTSVEVSLPAVSNAGLDPPAAANAIIAEPSGLMPPPPLPSESALSVPTAGNATRSESKGQFVSQGSSAEVETRSATAAAEARERVAQRLKEQLLEQLRRDLRNEDFTTSQGEPMDTAAARVKADVVKQPSHAASAGASASESAAAPRREAHRGVLRRIADAAWRGATRRGAGDSDLPGSSTELKTRDEGSTTTVAEAPGMQAERLKEQLLEQLRGEMRGMASTTTSRSEPLDEMIARTWQEQSTTTVAETPGMLAERLKKQLLDQLREEIRGQVPTTTSHTEPLDEIISRISPSTELKTRHEQSTTTAVETAEMLAERFKQQLLEQLRGNVPDQAPTTSQAESLDNIIARISRLTGQKTWHEESTTTVAETPEMLEERFKKLLSEQLGGEMRDQVLTTASHVESLDEIIARISQSTELKARHELSTTTVAETPEVLADQLKEQLLEQLRRKARDQVPTTTSSYAESLDDKIARILKQSLQSVSS